MTKMLDLEKLVEQANTPTPPSKIAEKTKRRIEYSLPLTIALAFFAYRFTHQALIPIVLAAAEALYVAQDILRLLAAAAERRRTVESELPFAATLLAMAATHSTPTATLKNTDRIPSLKNTAKEYFTILKHAHLNHTTPANAAAIAAQSHPSQRFQTFLRTISAAERGVGDPQASLEDTAKSELQNTAHQVELSSEKLNVASSTVLMMFAVLPLTLTVFSIIANQQSLLTLTYATTIPSLLLVNFLIEQAYPDLLKPKTHRPPPTAILAAAGAAAAAYFVTTRLAQPNLHITLAACLIAASAPLAVHYHRTTQKAHTQLLGSLPHLSRDIAEEAKKGSPPTAALRKLLSSNKYPAQLRQTLTESKTKPYIAQAYVDMLLESEKIGADPAQLENIAQTFNTIANTHTSYHSKSSFFKLTAYASAAILSAASVAITKTMQKLAASTAGYPAAITVGLLPHFSSAIQTKIYVVVVVNSYLLGLLAGKAHSGSILLGLADAAITTAIAAAITLGGLI